MTMTPSLRDELSELRDRVRGRVLTPDEPGFDSARAIWNAMVERHPAAVVRAADAADVAATVTFARDHHLELAVRGGGHNVAGNGTVDAGIVLDLGDLHGVLVDAANRTVRVQGGATLAHIDAATEPHGLAVPIGVVSGTGIGGLTLGGGVGWLTRAYGLSADSLLEAEVVTADGQTRTASQTDNPELFWALRGGGGNFGVVTAFTFRAYPHGPQVFSGNFLYGVDRWREAWAAVDEWTRDLPDAMTTITTTLSPPPILAAGDEPLMIVGFAWASSDRPAGEGLAERLRVLAPPDLTELGDVRWVDWQSAFDAIFPKGVRAYWRNTSFDRMDDEVIDVLVRRGAEQTWTGTAFDVHHMGGAFGRVPDGGTPFPRRDARFWLNIYGFWTDSADDDARVAFVRGLSEEMGPFATGGQYVNFLGRDEVSVTGHRPVDPRRMFGPAAYERLVAAKRRYDPDNLFHLNHNIPPG